MLAVALVCNIILDAVIVRSDFCKHRYTEAGNLPKVRESYCKSFRRYEKNIEILIWIHTHEFYCDNYKVNVYIYFYHLHEF